MVQCQKNGWRGSSIDVWWICQVPYQREIPLQKDIGVRCVLQADSAVQAFSHKILRIWAEVRAILEICVMTFYGINDNAYNCSTKAQSKKTECCWLFTAQVQLTVGQTEIAVIAGCRSGHETVKWTFNSILKHSASRILAWRNIFK